MHARKVHLGGPELLHDVRVWGVQDLLLADMWRRATQLIHNSVSHVRY